MHDNKGYWVYSCIVIIAFILLFAFTGYLVYDLIIKLSDKDFSNNTAIQALITLVITVFIGGYFSKWLERKNAKKLELYKIQTGISLRLIDLTSNFMWHPEDEEIKHLLLCESSKVKLYFNDEVLSALNLFINAETKESVYNELIDKLKKCVKE